ncbi:MAG: SapC family protein [Gammaproteobacteria bacterium]|nr:SapC family protein [Gammaproteobacteria bacterium]MDH3536049.1 SapC family protein [Gammaproteobacteria bacterium]
MSKTLLIYERAVPVNQARHGKCGVKASDDFGFASDVNSMPLLAQEFRDAVREYPIVFAGNEKNIMPAVLLGFGEHENLFVDEAGKWDAKYIPAFARRYPYVFSSSDDGKTLTLCIDEEFSGFNQEGEGERLFDDAGEQTPYLKKVLDFQTEFQRLFTRTQAFCKNLHELKLLDPMQAQVKFGSGQELTIGGFMVVNRARLKELPGEKLGELAGVDELELLYLHLQSLHNVTDLANRSRPDAGGAQAKESASGMDSEGPADAPDQPRTARAAKKKASPKKSGKGNSGNGKGEA